MLAGLPDVLEAIGTKSGRSLPPGINKKIIRILWGFIIIGCLPSEQATSNIESWHEKKHRLFTLFFPEKNVLSGVLKPLLCVHMGLDDAFILVFIAQRAEGRKRAWHSIWTTVFPVVGFDHNICVLWGHKQHVHRQQLD